MTAQKAWQAIKQYTDEVEAIANAPREERVEYELELKRWDGERFTPVAVIGPLSGYEATLLTRQLVGATSDYSVKEILIG